MPTHDCSLCGAPCWPIQTHYGGIVQMCTHGDCDGYDAYIESYRTEDQSRPDRRRRPAQRQADSVREE